MGEIVILFISISIKYMLLMRANRVAFLELEKFKFDTGVDRMMRC